MKKYLIVTAFFPLIIIDDNSILIMGGGHLNAHKYHCIALDTFLLLFFF